MNKYLNKHNTPYFIAEIGCNHNGSVDIAQKMVHVAKAAGADAVKFQTFRADELYAEDDPEYVKLKREELTFDEFRFLYDECGKADIDFISTPFDFACADFLDDLGVDVFKIGSGELTFIALLRHIAGKGKPVILSTGMSNIAAIDRAVNEILGTGNKQLSLLHCVSAYPVTTEEANVCTIKSLQKRYRLPVGYSDHTLEPYAAYTAVAYGAVIIEKHFTLSRRLPGDDHCMSLEPDELAETIHGIRKIESAKGQSRCDLYQVEHRINHISRRALYAKATILPGEPFSDDNIVVRRPLHEFGAEKLDDFLGKAAVCTIQAGSKLSRDMIHNP